MGYKNKYNPLLKNGIQKITDTNITTVGIGGDYVNVGLAIADNKNNLLLISDVIENANIKTPNGILYYNINLNGYNMNLDTFYFKGGADNITSFFNGNITFANIPSFPALTTNGKLYIYKCNIYNNSTSDLNLIARSLGTHIEIRKCKLYLPNYKYTGVDGDCLEGGIFETEIIGGGNNCTVSYVNGGTYFANVLFLGTFNTTNWNLVDCYLENCMFKTSCLIWINTANRLRTSLGAIVNVNRIYTNLTNSKLGSTSYIKIGTDIKSSNAKIDNVKLGYINVHSNAKNITIENSSFDSVVNNSISADNVIVSNSKFASGLTINYDNITINNCILDVGTITVSATADKTNISNCRTLTSIVDNGTNTILSNNQLI